MYLERAALGSLIARWVRTCIMKIKKKLNSTTSMHDLLAGLLSSWTLSYFCKVESHCRSHWGRGGTIPTLTPGVPLPTAGTPPNILNCVSCLKVMTFQCFTLWRRVQIKFMHLSVTAGRSRTQLQSPIQKYHREPSVVENSSRTQQIVNSSPHLLSIYYVPSFRHLPWSITRGGMVLLESFIE